MGEVTDESRKFSPEGVAYVDTANNSVPTDMNKYLAMKPLLASNAAYWMGWDVVKVRPARLELKKLKLRLARSIDYLIAYQPLSVATAIFNKSSSSTFQNPWLDFTIGMHASDLNDSVFLHTTRVLYFNPSYPGFRYWNCRLRNLASRKRRPQPAPGYEHASRMP